MDFSTILWVSVCCKNDAKQVNRTWKLVCV